MRKRVWPRDTRWGEGRGKGGGEKEEEQEEGKSETRAFRQMGLEGSVDRAGGDERDSQGSNCYTCILPLMLIMCIFCNLYLNFHLSGLLISLVRLLGNYSIMNEVHLATLRLLASHAAVIVDVVCAMGSLVPTYRISFCYAQNVFLSFIEQAGR